MTFQTIAAALMLMSALPAANELPQSQSPLSSTEGPANLGEVQVTGQRLREQVKSFIEEATAAPRGHGLARWNRPICLGVSNMDARYARFMIDRVTLIAHEVGLETEGPGCRPTIIVVAASDAEALAKALVDDDPTGFSPSVNATDLGNASLQRFQVTDAPVRWWHVSLPVTVDTGSIAVTLSGENQGPSIGSEGPPPLIVGVRDPSRLRSNTREDLARVFIIIDVTKTGRIGFGALSDYVAMVALAQIKPDANTSRFDSVLNLFSDQGDRTTGLTQWDRDYLASLYAARVDRARPTQQREDLLRGMIRARDPGSD